MTGILSGRASPGPDPRCKTLGELAGKRKLPGRSQDQPSGASDAPASAWA
ncbi:MAG: hypothetical protein ACLPN6_03155 [Streptosporangiaceae bacterium]